MKFSAETLSSKKKQKVVGELVDIAATKCLARLDMAGYVLSADGIQGGQKMRTIDAISMSDALDTVYNMDVSDCANAEEAVGKIYQAIGNLPNIDAVQVVRCKDCKHRRTDRCPMYHTETCLDDLDGFDDYTVDRTDDDGFCHLGARMDGEVK